jgi:hypothetical protein
MIFYYLKHLFNFYVRYLELIAEFGCAKIAGSKHNLTTMFAGWQMSL